MGNSESEGKLVEAAKKPSSQAPIKWSFTSITHSIKLQAISSSSSVAASNLASPTPAMFRRAKTTGTAPPATDGEVKVQKVDRIVYNIIHTKPAVHGANPKAAGMKRDHGSAAGSKDRSTASRSRGVVSVEDIDKRSEVYINKMRKQFLVQQ